MQTLVISFLYFVLYIDMSKGDIFSQSMLRNIRDQIINDESLWDIYLRLSCGSDGEFHPYNEENNSNIGCFKDVNLSNFVPGDIEYMYARYVVKSNTIFFYFGTQKSTLLMSIRSHGDLMMAMKLYNRCKNNLLVVNDEYNYRELQFNYFPVICKNGYKHNPGTHPKSYVHCFSGMYDQIGATRGGHCIKACVDQDNMYESYHLKDIYKSDNLHLECKQGYKKIIEENIICVQTGFIEFNWKNGNYKLKKLLDQNENKICKQIYCSDKPTKGVNSVSSLNINECVDKIEGEECNYTCPDNSSKLSTERLICNQGGWSNSYNCQCDTNSMINKDKTLCIKICTEEPIKENDSVISTDISSCANLLEGEECNYTCPDNSSKLSTERLTCNQNGWSNSYNCKCNANYKSNKTETSCNKVCSEKPTKENDSVISTDISSCANLFVGQECNYSCPDNSSKLSTERLTCNQDGWSNKYNCQCDTNSMINKDKTLCMLIMCKDAPEKEENSLILDDIISCSDMKGGEFCSYKCPGNSDKLSMERIVCISGNKWESKYNCKCKKLYIASDDKKSCQSKIPIYILGIVTIIFVSSLLIFVFVCLCRAMQKSKRKEKAKAKAKENQLCI